MTPTLVLDASAAIACAALGESPPDALLAAIKTETLIAPALWPFEVYHVLQALRRRSRITESDLSMALRVIDGLTVEIEPVSVTRVRTDILALATEYNLTVYDAAYLELAQRLGIPLATLDDEMRKAARKGKVKLL